YIFNFHIGACKHVYSYYLKAVNPSRAALGLAISAGHGAVAPPPPLPKRTSLHVSRQLQSKFLSYLQLSRPRPLPLPRTGGIPGPVTHSALLDAAWSATSLLSPAETLPPAADSTLVSVLTLSSTTVAPSSSSFATTSCAAPATPMPALALVLLDSLLKVAGGVAVGWLLRDRAARKDSSSSSSEGSTPAKKGGGKKAARRAGAAAATGSGPVPRPKEELKMVLCVNTSLRMGTGKVGAQCAHAAVGVLWAHYSSHSVAIRQWEMYGQPKIALKVRDEDEMAELEARAVSLGLPTYIVHDAGRTQIAAGSQTVLAIGPAPKSQLDSVTGHLKLL
ncbi:hypothetical protein Agub_g7200, partial [Astrephomene gubernaculifera]